MSHHIAIDRFSEELLGAGEEAAGEEDGGGRLVEQLERPVVDRDLVHLVCIHTSKELTHNRAHGLEISISDQNHSAYSNS